MPLAGGLGPPEPARTPLAASREAPERVWLGPVEHDGEMVWHHDALPWEDNPSEATEYVRADLVRAATPEAAPREAPERVWVVVAAAHTGYPGMPLVVRPRERQHADDVEYVRATVLDDVLAVHNVGTVADLNAYIGRLEALAQRADLVARRDERAATPGSPLDPALHEDVAQYREYFTLHAARDGACSPAMAKLVGDILGRIENALRASAPATEPSEAAVEAALDHIVGTIDPHRYLNDDQRDAAAGAAWVRVREGLRLAYAVDREAVGLRASAPAPGGATEAMREALNTLREPCTPTDRGDARVILQRALRAADRTREDAGAPNGPGSDANLRSHLSAVAIELKVRGLVTDPDPVVEHVVSAVRPHLAALRTRLAAAEEHHQREMATLHAGLLEHAEPERS